MAFVPSEPEEKKQFIVALRTICVLTFIGSGLMLFSYGMIFLFYDLFSTLMPSITLQENKELLTLLMSGGRWFFLCNALVFGASLWGAIKMWRMQANGFHWYATAQILSLIVPKLFIGGFPMQLTNIIFTALLILLYSRFVPMMKNMEA